MIGPIPSMADQATLSIAHGMELETLVACSDGSYDPITMRDSHGWLFANEGQDSLFQGAGLDDCDLSLMSSYRSELGGLIAVLYDIYRICMHHSVTSGKVWHYCDNRGLYPMCLTTMYLESLPFSIQTMT
jgi:hypothetical protein